MFCLIIYYMKIKHAINCVYLEFISHNLLYFLYIDLKKQTIFALYVFSVLWKGSVRCVFYVKFVVVGDILFFFSFVAIYT